MVAAYNNLGIALGSQGRMDEAIDQFRKALAIQPKFAQQLRMMNQENRALISLFWPAHHFQEPFGRFKFFGVMPELPGRNLLEGNVASPAKFTERIQSNRIQRLNAAILERGQFAKFAHMKFAVLLRREHRNDFGGKQRHQKPR